MPKWILAGMLALVALVPIAAGAAEPELKPTEIAGRWTGASYWEKGHGNLTLDIVACGDGWCGIQVGVEDKCGATALKIGGGSVDEGTARFEGTLELAPGTEPYTVHVAVFAREVGKPLGLQVTGDTGGEFRAFRRSFPFEAALFRTQDAVCHAPQTVSALR